MNRTSDLLIPLGLIGACFLSIAVSLPFDGEVVSSGAAAIVIGTAAAWRPHFGVATLLLVSLLAESAGHWFGAQLRFVDELGIPVLAVAIVLLHRSRFQPPRSGLREGALGVVVIAGILSSMIHGVPGSIWLPALALLLKAFAFFYVVLALRVDERDLGSIMRTFLLVGLVIVGIGLAQFVAPDATASALNLPMVEQQRGDIEVVNSVFTHPALYGWLAAFLSLFFYARFAVTRSRWTIPAAVLLNLSSVLSGRRTPVVGVLVALLVGVLRQVRGGVASVRAWLAVAVAGAVVLAVSMPLLGDFYRSTLIEYGEQTDVMAEVFTDDPDSLVLSTLQPRTALYLGSVAIGRDEFPLGVGLGRFGSHMSREAYSPAYEQYGLERIWGLAPHVPIAVTDTFWPMVLGETGVVGTLGMIGFLGILARDLWQASGRTASRGVRTLTLAALMVFTETAVRSLTSSVYLAPPIALITFATFGLALAVDRDVGGTGQPANDG